jgi:hypothetical protein
MWRGVLLAQFAAMAVRKSEQVLVFPGTVLARGVTMILARIAGLAVLLMTLMPFSVPAQELRPRSILLFDQSEQRGPFYYQVLSGLRSAENHTTGGAVFRLTPPLTAH